MRSIYSSQFTIFNTFSCAIFWILMKVTWEMIPVKSMSNANREMRKD